MHQNLSMENCIPSSETGGSNHKLGQSKILLLELSSFYHCFLLCLNYSHQGNGRPKYSSTVCAQTDSKLTSKIFVNCFSTNVRLMMCAQMFQCTNSSQEHSSSDTSDSKRTPEIFVNRLTSVSFCCVPYGHSVYDN